MRRVPYPRIQILGARPEGGGWALERENTPEGEKYQVHFLCPACSAYSSLKDHSIDRRGDVMPSFPCPQPVRYKRSANQIASKPCLFHEFPTLKDWPENMEKKAGELYVTVYPGAETDETDTMGA